MSRRMLLEDNYSNDGLMPVMDGLVCWLDGRDYNGEGSVKDRVDKKEFIVKGIDFNGSSFLYDKNNSIVYSEVAKEENLYDLFNSDFTLCIVDKIAKKILASTYPRLVNFGQYSTNSPYQLIYQPDGGYECIQFCNRERVASSIFKNIDICSDLSKKNITIVKQGKNVSFYKNGIKFDTIEDSDVNNILNLTRITLGQAYSATDTRVYYGDIYSFIAYNRALSEKEIEQNYLYEQSIDRRIQNKTTLTTGTSFNSIINELKSKSEDNITKIIFTKSAIQDNELDNAKIVSNGDSDYVNCYAYAKDNAIYISPEVEGCTIYANKDCSSMFRNQSNLTSIEFNNFDTSNTTNMGDMFNGSSKLNDLNVSDFNTSNVTSIGSMFRGLSSITMLDVSKWNTSKVTVMGGLFAECSKLTEINVSNFNTSKVTNMAAMFQGCTSLTCLNIKNFNTNNATDMSWMFYGTKLNELDLSSFCTSNVLNFNKMFNNSLIKKIKNFNLDFSKATNTSYMFQNATNISLNITINNSNIATYGSMFHNASISADSEIIVKYIDEETKAMAEKLIETKSTNSNVFLWEGDDN